MQSRGHWRGMGVWSSNIGTIQKSKRTFRQWSCLLASAGFNCEGRRGSLQGKGRQAIHSPSKYLFTAFRSKRWGYIREWNTKNSYLWMDLHTNREGDNKHNKWGLLWRKTNHKYGWEGGLRLVWSGGGGCIFR